MGNRRFQLAVDLLDFTDHFSVGKVEVMCADEISGVGLALNTCCPAPHPSGNNPHDADQGTGLLKPLVLLKACVQVTNRRVKRVTAFNVCGKLFRGRARDVHQSCSLERLGITLSDFTDFRFVRDFGEEPRPQNMVELVGIDPHGVNRHRKPNSLISQVFQGCHIFDAAEHVVDLALALLVTCS